jgi:hypothetical protein
MIIYGLYFTTEQDLKPIPLQNVTVEANSKLFVIFGVISVISIHYKLHLF